MSQFIPIQNFKTGLDRYDQPEQMPNDGFPEILDVVLFRGVLEKRDGSTSLIVPPTFSISNISNALNGVVTTLVAHGFSTGDLVMISGVGGMTEINNTAIQPFSITVTGLNTFQLNLDTLLFGVYTTGGIVQRIAYTGPIGIQTIANDAVGTVTTLANHNLTTNQVVFIQGVQGMTEVNSTTTFYTITVTGLATFQLNVSTAAYGVYTSGGGVYQPIQGLKERETATFFKDLIAFNESQAFLFDATTNEFNNISGTTTWTGNATNFFWSTNFQRAFWATNYVDPIRYYLTGSTWTDYRPVLFGTTFSNEVLGPGIPLAAVTYGPFIVANPPIIPGTVVVNIAAGTLPGVPAARLIDDGLGVLSPAPGFPAGYAGTVNYTTGSINLTAVVPEAAIIRAVTVTYDQEGDRLERALMIFPYKDRMIALSTYEGAGFVEFPQRCRYSQNGSVFVTSPVPTSYTFNANAWRQDVAGRGGFIDAPIGERIITAGFVRDVLVVLFEFSAWRLRYTANEAIPFVWERISSQYGSESTYSAIEFDNGVLSVGRTGVIATEPNSCQRIDEIIPDQVYQISNLNNSQRRVQGIRDYQRQLAYWTFPEGDEVSFPNRTLVFNYLENNWTLYRQEFTAFGQFRRDDTLTWGTALSTWGEEGSLWGSGDLQSGYPSVVAGNKLGKVFRLDRQFTTDDDEPFNFSITTKKFNPFIDQGLQCKAVYLYLLLQGTTSLEFTIEHYIDEDLSTPVATYVVSTATSSQEKVWRRVALSAIGAQYHQFKFLFSEDQFDDSANSSQDVEIYQMVLEVVPAGRLNYGFNE